MERERLPVQARGAIERERRGRLIRRQHQVMRGLLEIARCVEVHADDLGTPRGIARSLAAGARGQECPRERTMTPLAQLGVQVLEHGLADSIVIRLDGALPGPTCEARQVRMAQAHEGQIDLLRGHHGRRGEELGRQRPARHGDQREELPRRRVQLGDPRP
ncbi:MAG TPA: hypothetical protein VK932_30675, partial [Kofleriaceae bacterium]|nr:hypothetical protein [Kofleriaceae bacterium]